MRGQELLTFSLNWSGDHVDEVFESPPLPKALLSENGGSEPISALNAVIEEYRHRVTGAQHFHIATDNTENVFLVALRTVPQDSTGVAHILEHTALCGSEKYPVRDPFFMMTRRSLNTFMKSAVI